MTGAGSLCARSFVVLSAALTLACGASPPVPRVRAAQVDACMGASVRPIVLGVSSALEDRAAFVCACVEAGTPAGSAGPTLTLDVSARSIEPVVRSASGPPSVVECITERTIVVARAWLATFSADGARWDLGAGPRQTWDFVGIDCDSVDRREDVFDGLSSEWLTTHPGGVSESSELPDATCPLDSVVEMNWVVAWGGSGPEEL